MNLLYLTNTREDLVVAWHHSQILPKGVSLVRYYSLEGYKGIGTFFVADLRVSPFIRNLNPQNYVAVGFW